MLQKTLKMLQKIYNTEKQNFKKKNKMNVVRLAGSTHAPIH